MAQQPQAGGMFGGGGLMSTVATGMALGAGSEVGHQAVRSMMGGGGGHGGGGHSEPAAQEQPMQQPMYAQE